MNNMPLSTTYKSIQNQLLTEDGPHCGDTTSPHFRKTGGFHASVDAAMPLLSIYPSQKVPWSKLFTYP